VNSLHQKKIQSSLAAGWNASSFSFVISNGINIISGEPEGRDLDVFVDGKDYHKIIQTTKQTLEALSFKVGIHWKSHTAWMFAFGPDGEVFEVDFFHYQQWHYFRFITTPRELDDVISLGEFKFSPFAWLVKNILIQLLAKNFKKVESRTTQLETLLVQHPSVLENTAHMLGSQVASSLEALSKAPTREKFKNLSALLRTTCASLILCNPARWPQAGISTLRWAQKILEHKVICRKMCPTLALVGVDGSGKSTVLQALQTSLPSAFPFWRIVNRHWRPGFLPLLSSFSANPPEIKPGEAVIPRSKPGKLGFLRSIYYSLDFILGYFFKDRPVTTNIEALIYDRHFGDMIVDPVRFGISGNLFLLGISPLVPKPDILILLHATPEIARARKGELSDEKVAYLNAEWVRLGPRLGKEFHVVDAGLPVAEIAEKISIIYISNLKQKLNYEKTNTKSN
jgi:hypothetical protein